MRIIVANDELDIGGGASKCAVLSAVELAKLGVETVFFCANGEPPAEVANATGLTIHNMGWPQEPASTGRTIRNAWNQAAYDAMQAEIANGDPAKTIVHLHIWAVFLSPSVVRAAQDAGAHVMVSLHDYHAACPQGQFFDVRGGYICTRRPGSIECVTRFCTEGRTYLSKASHLYRWSVQRGKGGLPTSVRHFGMFSPKSIEVLRPFLPAEAQIHLMHYPIDVQQRPRVEAAKNRRFVMSGRVSREKNPKLLVEAARKIGAEVRFIGDGPLRGEVEAMGYEKASFSGWVSGETVQEELAQARTLVLPSIWYEVNPLAPVEALGLGIPVLASDATTTTGEIVEGETGFAFRSKDAASLAEVMSKMLDDDRCDRMSRAAYERFWNRPPTPPNHAKLLIQAYESILAEPAGTAGRELAGAH